MTISDIDMGTNEDITNNSISENKKKLGNFGIHSPKGTNLNLSSA